MSIEEQVRGLEKFKEAVTKVFTLYPNRVNINVPHNDQWIYLASNLTAAAWDGDARSTESKTLIDLSTVFGVPAGVKAVAVRLIARDSGSSGATCFFAVSPNSNAGHSAVEVYRDKVTNDALDSKEGVCPCDANGDIYYQIAASGAGTLDAWLEIVGYYI